MSELKLRVGAYEWTFESAPRGKQGVVHVRDTAGKLWDVAYRSDSQGIELLWPDRVTGFDLATEAADSGRASYRISQRGSDLEWEGVEVLRAGEQDTAASGTGAKKSARVRAQMPGKVVKVLVTEGQEIAKDQPLLVMEAMKMENEIKAPMAGRVAQLKAASGQTVETGADLLRIE